jgi:hypothetical protein
LILGAEQDLHQHAYSIRERRTARSSFGEATT